MSACRNPHWVVYPCPNRMTQEDGLCDDCRWGRENLPPIPGATDPTCELSACACGTYVDRP